MDILTQQQIANSVLGNMEFDPDNEWNNRQMTTDFFNQFNNSNNDWFDIWKQQ